MKLGIFSWNIGNNLNEITFRNIFTKLDKYNKCDIIIFGFQEVPGTLLSNMDSVINQLLLNTTKYSKHYNSFKNISSIIFFDLHFLQYTLM